MLLPNLKLLTAKLVSLLGWLVFAFSLAVASWAVISWLFPAETYLPAEQTKPTAQAAWAKSLNSYFISQQKIAVEEPSFQQQVARSRLPISVQGVVFSNQANRSVALIKYRQQFLTLVEGDELDAGVRLVKITQHALIFNNYGQLEEIALNLDAANNALLSSNEQPPLERNSINRNIQTENSSFTRQPISEERLGTRVLEDTFGANFKESLLKDPLQLMSYITLVPVNENGKLKGFRLRPGIKPELFNHFELQANDLLLAVDGIAVNNTREMLQLTNKLAAASSVSVDIQRGEEIIRKYLDME